MRCSAPRRARRFARLSIRTAISPTSRSRSSSFSRPTIITFPWIRRICIGMRSAARSISYICRTSSTASTITRASSAACAPSTTPLLRVLDCRILRGNSRNKVRSGFVCKPIAMRRCGSGRQSRTTRTSGTPFGRRVRGAAKTTRPSWSSGRSRGTQRHSPKRDSAAVDPRSRCRRTWPCSRRLPHRTARVRAASRVFAKRTEDALSAGNLALDIVRSGRVPLRPRGAR